jgi:hypothetical protein
MENYNISKKIYQSHDLKMDKTEKYKRKKERILFYLFI